MSIFVLNEHISTERRIGGWWTAGRAGEEARTVWIRESRTRTDRTTSLYPFHVGRQAVALPSCFGALRPLV